MYNVYNHHVKPTLCNYVPDAVYPTNERVKIKSMKVLNTISEGDTMHIFTERETVLWVFNNQLQVNVPFLFPTKRNIGYRNATLAWNEINTICKNDRIIKKLY